jgi:hypothetical protein
MMCLCEKIHRGAAWFPAITKVNLQEPMAPVNLLCQLVGTTRSAYYKAAQRQKKNNSRDKIILEEVKRIRKNLPRHEMVN